MSMLKIFKNQKTINIMKRSITKSLKKRIEQSSQSIIDNVLNRSEIHMCEQGKRAVALTGSRLAQVFKRLCVALFAVFLLFCVACFFASCNVTRTITNESQYFQRGDTSVVIQTRTIETYDATKNL